jgi:exonuclease III
MTSYTVPQAKAQEPIKLRMKIMLGKTIKFATLSVRGIKKPGAREEIEYWMTEKEIDILCLQETRNNQNSRESRKSYTWFFSGEGGRQEYTAGVGMVINNNFLKYIEDIEPVNDRLMFVTLRGIIESNIICTYMPPAERQNHLERLVEDKDKAYDEIQKVIDKKKNKGPMYICGDWNARLIYPTSTEEELIIGKHTLHGDASALELFTTGMLENREKS